ncbi:MAG: hypothetical protein KDB79_12420 [Acidobacteria bacterium]|nr:hypothetical protein [Acidobacteriota bacterium]
MSGKRGVTPSTPLRLAKFFGMNEGFWLNLQMRLKRAGMPALRQWLKTGDL